VLRLNLLTFDGSITSKLSDESEAIELLRRLLRRVKPTLAPGRFTA